jgi:hypothetical protein
VWNDKKTMHLCHLRNKELIRDPIWSRSESPNNINGITKKGSPQLCANHYKHVPGPRSSPVGSDNRVSWRRWCWMSL